MDDQEFYRLMDADGISDDIMLSNAKLRKWGDDYNCHRPHGALGGQRHYERLLKTAKRRVIRVLRPLHTL